MTADHLLPANATPLEQTLSLATDPLFRLALPADAIRQFKSDPSDPLLPWLIWEYGLGELLPYLPEPRRAIAEGILWQRLRGTPAALATALSWIGMRATVEQEPPGVHFAEFQLDPGQVLDSDTAIANLIAIARLSAPARSRLSRIYHGYDLRRVVLDESRLGEALLSDHSGVFWRDGQTKAVVRQGSPMGERIHRHRADAHARGNSICGGEVDRPVSARLLGSGRSRAYAQRGDPAFAPLHAGQCAGTTGCAVINA
ncbi:phage tail protein [Stutzerimonas balearica]|uniref:phage tail protein n=1 Tax=Stutzerimonas balearica TaxID=74829 RepID=UPI0022AF2534|nr:phage tail protein [Stutzerimonas balearica]MCZ4128623.1 phage tail protein [Stutzerimonas balearica]